MREFENLKMRGRKDLKIAIPLLTNKFSNQQINQ